MIIYNKEWLNNRKIQDQTSLAFEHGEIDEEELKSIKEKRYSLEDTEKKSLKYHMPGTLTS